MLSPQDLQELAKPYRHPAKDIFSRYSILKIAKKIQTTPGYLYNILRGSAVPSKKLNNKILQLAADLEAAEALTAADE